MNEQQKIALISDVADQFLFHKAEGINSIDAAKDFVELVLRAIEKAKSNIETGWLIEQTGLDRPYWLCGSCPGYITGTFPFAFSADSNDVIRFSRKQDALELALYFDDINLTVTEHQWG